MARFLTLSATMAKPAPAFPALAASTAAFKDRKLVWTAISSIVLMILYFSSLALEISLMDWINWHMEDTWPEAEAT